MSDLRFMSKPFGAVSRSGYVADGYSEAFSLEMQPEKQNARKMPLIGTIGLGLVLSLALWGGLFVIIRLLAAHL